MKTLLVLMCLLASAITPGALAAEGQRDFFSTHLFPPDLIMHNQEKIELSSSQREAIMAVVQKAEKEFRQAEQQLKESLQPLTEILEKEKPDAEQALSKLDAILKNERLIKRAQMAMLIEIKSQLTSKQQGLLRELASRQQLITPKQAEALQRRLTAKLEKVQQGVERWQEAGRDPMPVAELMQGFTPLMQNAKHQQAEALLDKVLKMLEENE